MARLARKEKAPPCDEEIAEPCWGIYSSTNLNAEEVELEGGGMKSLQVELTAKQVDEK